MERTRAIAAAILLGTTAAVSLLVGLLRDTDADGNRVAGNGTPHPNVVLIILDTLRADRLGSYGFEHDTSPELDAMAKRGVRFHRAVAQAPWTRPSIGSMLTSTYPRTLGLYKEKDEVLNDRFTTLAEVFRQSGYRTIGSTANPSINGAFNFQQGFDHYVDSNVVWRFMEAKENQTKITRSKLASARDRFGEVLRALDRENPQDRAKPHYVQVNVMEVHESFKKVMLREEYGALEFGERRDTPYLQSIRQLSNDVNEFVEALLARDGWEDTIVVLVSDHGEGLFDHPDVPNSRHHGGLLYRSQVVVPFILFDTTGRLPRGLVVERPVRLLDLMPTVVRLAGVTPPRGMQGVSLTPLLSDAGEEVELPAYFVVETRFRQFDKMGVYHGSYELFDNRDAHPGSKRIELQVDGRPENGEETDVGDAHPDLRESLSKYLESWERGHPRTPPTRQGEDLAESVVEQLRALGYVP